MFISGGGKDIEITLLEISGTEYHRRVRLAIEGIEEIIKPLELSADCGYFNLAKDIKIRVSNGSDWKKDKPGTSVFIDYNAPKEDYKMDRKEYKKELIKDPNKQPIGIVNENHPVGFYFMEEWRKMNPQI
jgi:hypothetical protein